MLSLIHRNIVGLPSCSSRRPARACDELIERSFVRGNGLRQDSDVQMAFHALTRSRQPFAPDVMLNVLFNQIAQVERHLNIKLTTFESASMAEPRISMNVCAQDKFDGAVAPSKF